MAWEQIGQPTGKVWWPAVDPKDASYVCVVADVGLCRSIDEGKIWGWIWATTYGRKSRFSIPPWRGTYSSTTSGMRGIRWMMY